MGGSIGAQFLLVFWRPLQDAFQTEALTGYDVAYILMASTSVLWLDCLRKKFLSQYFQDHNHPETEHGYSLLDQKDKKHNGASSSSQSLVDYKDEYSMGDHIHKKNHARLSLLKRIWAALGGIFILGAFVFTVVLPTTEIAPHPVSLSTLLEIAPEGTGSSGP